MFRSWEEGGKSHADFFLISHPTLKKKEWAWGDCQGTEFFCLIA